MTRRIVLVASVLWVFLDVVRMWTPSLITIFGRAAETPAELIGAFALACGVLPLLILWITRSAYWLEIALLFVLLVPEQANETHLQLLSELAQMFSDRDFRETLHKASDTAQIHRLFVNWGADAANQPDPAV